MAAQASLSSRHASQQLRSPTLLSSRCLCPYVSAQQSFVRAKSWVKELQRQGSANIVIALAGNKLDLAEQRQVDLEEAKVPATAPNQARSSSHRLRILPAVHSPRCPLAVLVLCKAYADDNNIFLLETSAKSNTNVTEIFKQIATALPKTAPAPKTNVVAITEGDILANPEEKKKCC